MSEISKAECIIATMPQDLTKAINEFAASHNVVATQIYPPSEETRGWVAFVWHKVKA